MLVEVEKHFNILATGTQYFLILNSHYDPASDYLLRELSFNHCVERINSMKPCKKILETKYELQILFLSKILHLWLLLEYYPNLTPQQYIFNQLNGYGYQIDDIKLF